MRAIAETDGRLALTDLPLPEPGSGEVRVAVRATAVNRADLVQRAGHYAPPPGESHVLGLECAGVIDALGPDLAGWSVGDRVCALLAGGGYASHVLVPAGQLLPMGSLSFDQAAALPEAICTAHDALFTQGDLAPGERVLLHAGASGVGTIAIQLCREAGSPCFVTVGGAEKIDRCVALGAEAGWNRHDGPWTAAPWLAEGVDLIVDPVGRGYLADDLRALRPRGRVVLLGLMGGRTEEIDLGRVLLKRLRIQGTVLRSRTRAEKAAVVRAVATDVWPLVQAGRVQPVVHAVLPLERAEQAHALVRSNTTIGKVVLTVGD